MKQIEINKFTDQVISMMDDICDKNIISSINPNSDSNKNENKNIIDNLKDIIKNAYIIFSNSCSLNDDSFIIYNFITKISLFISNQSLGKYSDSNINLFLKYLLKINEVNVEIYLLKNNCLNLKSLAL